MTTDSRGLPLARVEMYPAGGGDPYVSDWGFFWYDPIEKTAKRGSVETWSGKVPRLEVIEGVGLVCAGEVQPVSLVLADWDTVGGNWEVRSPESGLLRSARLWQLASTANATWSATSIRKAIPGSEDETKTAPVLPENPAFAVTFGRAETPTEQDASTDAYAQVEFGGGEWAICWHDRLGTILTRAVEGVTTTVLNLAAGQGANAEVIVMVRVQYGKLCLRFLHQEASGEAKAGDWTVYSNPDGTKITVAAGDVAFRGNGISAWFGLHQLKMYEGVYHSMERPLDSAPASSPTAWARYNAPVTVPAAEEAAYPWYAVTPLGGVTEAHYHLTITPKVKNCWLFPAYCSAAVAGVGVECVPVTVDRKLEPVEMAAERVTALTIDKPLELDGSTAAVSMVYGQESGFGENLRWRKVRIWLGDETNGYHSHPKFTGYLREQAVEQSDYGVVNVTYTLDNVTVRAKRMKFNELQGSIPLGGKTINAALNWCLAYMGLAASGGDWDESGDARTLPEGDPAEPFMWPAYGETLWEVMEKIARYGKLELSTSTGGRFETVPLGYVSNYAWDVSDVPEDVAKALTTAKVSQDASAGYTAIITRGTSGETPLYAHAVDTDAETNTGGNRFCPWREVYDEDAGSGVDVGILTSLVQSLFTERTQPRVEAEVTLPARVEMHRRDTVRFAVNRLGLNYNAEWVIYTQRYEYRNDPTWREVRTTLGLKRNWPV